MHTVIRLKWEEEKKIGKFVRKRNFGRGGRVGALMFRKVIFSFDFLPDLAK